MKYDYVRRCKYRVGDERYERVHAATATHTLCGKKLDMMWYYEDSEKLTPSDVTCAICKQRLTLDDVPESK
jgi:hypothetical protein